MLNLPKMQSSFLFFVPKAYVAAVCNLNKVYNSQFCN